MPSVCCQTAPWCVKLVVIFEPHYPYRRFIVTDTSKPQTNAQPKNPLHGITLERLLTELVEHYGWEELGARINIRCFTHDPSIKSSLKFLRKTQWARDKVEKLYIDLKHPNQSIWKQ